MADVRCPSCGASHDADHLFCPRCGAGRADTPTVRVDNEAATTAEHRALFAELTRALTPRIQVMKELGARLRAAGAIPFN